MTNQWKLCHIFNLISLMTRSVSRPYTARKPVLDWLFINDRTLLRYFLIMYFCFILLLLSLLSVRSVMWLWISLLYSYHINTHLYALLQSAYLWTLHDLYFPLWIWWGTVVNDRLSEVMAVVAAEFVIVKANLNVRMCGMSISWQQLGKVLWGCVVWWNLSSLIGVVPK